MKPFIIYHKSCMDGAGAALAAWLRFGDDATYWYAAYGDAPPDPKMLEERNVFVLDFSYPRDVLAGIALIARDLTVIDHHKTAQAELAGVPGTIFDMNKSGAVLAWEHFFPSEPLPKLFEYIQDRDLWQWRLPYSRELSAYLGSIGVIADFRILAKLLHLESFTTHAAEGAAILRYQNQLVESAARVAVLRTIANQAFYVVNGTTLSSEIGHALCRRMVAETGSQDGRAAIWRFDERKEVFYVSLRGTGNVDVAEVARLFGGGGHRHAAGFDCKTLPWLA